jgi:multidrug transporter EmrE-like cation transporter
VQPAQKMRSTKTLHIKTYILLFLLVSAGSLGNTVLDKGMKDIGSIDVSSRAGIWTGALHILTSGTIWLGVLCMLLFMICHMLVLSWADYSFVMPFSAVSYAVVPLLGYLWLGESVPPIRWVGIALIVLGVLLVSRTPPSTTEPALNPLGVGPF